MNSCQQFSARAPTSAT